MDRFETLCDELDAAVFSGDSLEDAKTRSRFAEYLGRWQRRLEELELFQDPIHTRPGESLIETVKGARDE